MQLHPLYYYGFANLLYSSSTHRIPHVVWVSKQKREQKDALWSLRIRCWRGNVLYALLGMICIVHIIRYILCLLFTRIILTSLVHSHVSIQSFRNHSPIPNSFAWHLVHVCVKEGMNRYFSNSHPHSLFFTLLTTHFFFTQLTTLTLFHTTRHTHSHRMHRWCKISCWKKVHC
jgi:hypothetical protein